MKITSQLLEQLGFEYVNNHYWLNSITPITMTQISYKAQWVLETVYGADIVSESKELLEKIQTQMYQGGRENVLTEWENSFKKAGVL